MRDAVGERTVASKLPSSKLYCMLKAGGKVCPEVQILFCLFVSASFVSALMMRNTGNKNIT